MRLLCGDGELLPTEECDDGNPDDGDECSSACMYEYRIVFVSSVPARSRLVCERPTTAPVGRSGMALQGLTGLWTTTTGEWTQGMKVSCMQLRSIDGVELAP